MHTYKNRVHSVLQIKKHHRGLSQPAGAWWHQWLQSLSSSCTSWVAWATVVFFEFGSVILDASVYIVVFFNKLIDTAPWSLFIILFDTS